MLGVIANTVAVIVGSVTGLVFSGLISQKYTKAVMTAIGLCTLYIGFSGSLSGKNALVTVSSLVFGTLIGSLINIDGGIEWIGKRLEGKNDGNKASVAVGFVTASLLFCVGSMTVVGSLNAGISGDNTLLFTKSLLDLISSAMLAASLGIGVLYSSVFVFVFQGALVLLAGYIAPFLNEAMQGELICVGSVMIIAIGLNLLGITKIKVANMLPAIIFAVFLTEPLNALLTLIK